MSNFSYSYPYQADAPFAGLNSRGIALMLREEPQVGTSYQMLSTDTEPQTVNPQNVFHDYEAVMARHAPRYAEPTPEVLEAPKIPRVTKPKRDLDSRDDDEVFDNDFDNPLTIPAPAPTLATSHHHPSSPNSRRQSTSTRNRSDPYPAPTTTRHASRVNASTSSPLRPGTRRWAAFNNEEILPPSAFPHGFKLLANAQHTRQFTVKADDLHEPTFACPYIHPVTGEACRDGLRPFNVVWPMVEDHWKIHVVKECRWMLTKALRVGHGNVIRSRGDFDAYRKNMSICDICGDGFSKSTGVERHKQLMHPIGESGQERQCSKTSTNVRTRFLKASS